MNRRRLGKSGITVSEICLGTMTFGLQSDEKESFAIMDKAYEAGVNFLDTAERYTLYRLHLIILELLKRLSVSGLRISLGSH